MLIDYNRYNLGWRPSIQPITLTTLGNMVLQLYTAGPSPIPEGAKITADSYKDVFNALIGSADFFRQLTGGISDYVGLS